MPQFKAGAREAGEHLKSHKAIHDGESEYDGWSEPNVDHTWKTDSYRWCGAWTPSCNSDGRRMSHWWLGSLGPIGSSARGWRVIRGRGQDPANARSDEIRRIPLFLPCQSIDVLPRVTTRNHGRVPGDPLQTSRRRGARLRIGEHEGRWVDLGGIEEDSYVAGFAGAIFVRPGRAGNQLVGYVIDELGPLCEHRAFADKADILRGWTVLHYASPCSTIIAVPRSKAKSSQRAFPPVRVDIDPKPTGPR